MHKSLRNKMISSLLITSVVIGCSACKTSESTTEPVQTDFESLDTEYTEDTTEDTTESVVDDKWYTYTVEAEAGDGYHLNETVKISNWIAESDKSALSSAWNEVSVGKEFPGHGELGINKGSVEQFSGVALCDWDEVYYLVGTVSLENNTPGFDLSEKDYLDAQFTFSAVFTDNHTDATNFPISLWIGYANGENLYLRDGNGFHRGWGGGGWYPPSARMTKNTWKVPFVIALAVDKTPNHPDGKPDRNSVAIYFGRDILNYNGAWGSSSGNSDSSKALGSVANIISYCKKYLGMNYDDAANEIQNQLNVSFTSAMPSQDNLTIFSEADNQKTTVLGYEMCPGLTKIVSKNTLSSLSFSSDTFEGEGAKVIFDKGYEELVSLYGEPEQQDWGANVVAYEWRISEKTDNGNHEMDIFIYWIKDTWNIEGSRCYLSIGTIEDLQ